MKVVADTNTAVSGLLWHGAPREVLDAARAGRIRLYTSEELLAELLDVLQRPKFAKRLDRAGVAAQELVTGYAALAELATPARVGAVVAADADDDALIACAVGAGADVIVSGDHHLLDLGEYDEIAIVTARQLLDRIAAEQD